MTILTLSQFKHIYSRLHDKESLHIAIETFKECETYLLFIWIVSMSSVSPDTIRSIYRTKWTEKVKKLTFYYIKLENTFALYQKYKDYKAKALPESTTKDSSQILHHDHPRSINVILMIARELHIPSCLICRILLRAICLESYHHQTEKFIKDFIRRTLNNLDTLDDPQLIDEIKECILEDDICSPIGEKLKNQMGREKEELLHQKLTLSCISYINESGMRHLGFPKTPDALLSIPIAIDGCVVNWVECKAFFGDFYLHEYYLKQQYWPYHNRFGPGLVIYWNGFIKELNKDQHQGILIREDFPDEFIKIETLIKY